MIKRIWNCNALWLCLWVALLCYDVHRESWKGCLIDSFFLILTLACWYIEWRVVPSPACKCVAPVREIEVYGNGIEKLQCVKCHRVFVVYVKYLPNGNLSCAHPDYGKQDS